VLILIGTIAAVLAVVLLVAGVVVVVVADIVEVSAATAVVSAALLSPELQAAIATRAVIDIKVGRAVRRFMESFSGCCGLAARVQMTGLRRFL
jgi:hypothetical protein